MSWHRVDVADPAVTPGLAEVFAGADAVVNFAWGFQPTRNAEYLHRVGPGAVRSIADAAAAAGVGQSFNCPRWVRIGPPIGPVNMSMRAGRHGNADVVVQPAQGGGGTGARRVRAAVRRVVVTRIRPGLVMQREAGGSLARYGLPGYLPAMALRLLPVVPVGRRLVVPVVHADDVAGAIVAAVERRAGGAFNLAAEPAVTGTDIAAILRAWSVSVPPSVLHFLAQLTWRLRLQRIDAGWVDLAFSVPLLDCSRARAELDWRPTVDPRVALARGHFRNDRRRRWAESGVATTNGSDSTDRPVPARSDHHPRDALTD